VKKIIMSKWTMFWIGYFVGWGFAVLSVIIRGGTLVKS